MRKGKKLSVTIQDGRSIITAETPNFRTQTHKVKEPDANLRIIGYIHNYTFWYNSNTDTFWISTYNDKLRCHTNWRELEDHDRRFFYIFGLADRLHFNNPFPNRIRVRKGDKLRLRRFLDRKEGKKAKK